MASRDPMLSIEECFTGMVLGTRRKGFARKLSKVLVVLALSSISLEASAQEGPPAVPPKPASVVPRESPSKGPTAGNSNAAKGNDIVRLKSGGMVRGTLAENLPGEYVIIVTVAGAKRRFAAKDVEYAGPEESPPRAVKTSGAGTDSPDTRPAPEAKPEPVPTSEKKAPRIDDGSPPRHKLTFRSYDETPVTVHRQLSTAFATTGRFAAVGASYERLCTAPCEVEIPEGSHVLALSIPGVRLPREAGDISLTENQTVTGHYVSRQSVRTAGFVTGLAGILIGGIAMAMGFSRDDNGNTNRGALYAGLGIMTVGLAVGLPLTLIRDEAEIR